MKEIKVDEWITAYGGDDATIRIEQHDSHGKVLENYILTRAEIARLYKWCCKGGQNAKV